MGQQWIHTQLEGVTIMKRSLFIGWVILAVAFSYACTKKQNLPEKQSTEADVSVQNNDSMNRKPFKFTITTDIDEKADDEDVKIILSINKLDGKQTILYDLDCESDGEYEFTGLSDDHECIYKPNTGTHQISVRGEILGLYLCARHPNEEACTPNHIGFRCDISSGEDASIVALKSIDSWGDISWKSMFAFAADCERLEIIPDEVPDLSHVKNMSYMFSGAESFNQPLEKWDVSNVTDMSLMFWGAKSFNQPLDKWNVSNVTNMSDMFWAAESLNQPLDKWNVSNVTNMSDMFRDAVSFNQPLEKWDVSNVTDMSMMFSGAESFNQPLEKWDVSNVTDMSSMFWGAESFNQPLDKWNVSKVTNMSGMFWHADSFNQPLEKWNVSNVTNMRKMFLYADSFNQPLEKWNVSKVTDVDEMFNGASKFSYYPKSWVVPENSEDMFTGTKVEDIAEKEPLKRR